jgi:dihydroorotate dehydrogenase (NAD+) catalytic subunit
LKQTGTAVIANLGGSTLEEMAEGAALLEETSVDMIELNFSCPNVKKGGMAFGIKAETAKEAVQCVRAATKKPLL